MNDSLWSALRFVWGLVSYAVIGIALSLVALGISWLAVMLWNARFRKWPDRSSEVIAGYAEIIMWVILCVMVAIALWFLGNVHPATVNGAACAVGLFVGGLFISHPGLSN